VPTLPAPKPRRPGSPTTAEIIADRPRPLVIIYLDTSAAMKLLVEEDESPACTPF